MAHYSNKLTYYGHSSDIQNLIHEALEGEEFLAFSLYVG